MKNKILFLGDLEMMMTLQPIIQEVIQAGQFPDAPKDSVLIHMDDYQTAKAHLNEGSVALIILQPPPTSMGTILGYISPDDPNIDGVLQYHFAFQDPNLLQKGPNMPSHPRFHSVDPRYVCNLRLN